MIVLALKGLNINSPGRNPGEKKKNKNRPRKIVEKNETDLSDEKEIKTKK